MPWLPSNRWPLESKEGYTYALLLQAEAATSDAAKLMRIRLLGGLLYFGPEAFRSRLVEEISSAVDIGVQSSESTAVSDFYLELLFRMFRTETTGTPAENSHPSHPSFDLQADLLRELLKEPPKSHVDAMRQALIRDGYRCALSKSVDSHTAHDADKARKPIPGVVHDQDTNYSLTQCAHIFGRSINNGVSTDQVKMNHASTSWAVLSRMSPNGQTMFEELNGKGIHRLQNIITMEGSIHDAFDSLNLWLEHIDGNTYNIRVRDNRVNNNLVQRFNLRTVTFETPDETLLPVPSREYLELHALCAKVADLSGAADYILKILDDVNEGSTAVLAEDGSDAHVLDMMMSRANITVQ